jgi:hypothetical protein
MREIKIIMMIMIIVTIIVMIIMINNNRTLANLCIIKRGRKSVSRNLGHVQLQLESERPSIETDFYRHWMPQQQMPQRMGQSNWVRLLAEEVWLLKMQITIIIVIVIVIIIIIIVIITIIIIIIIKIIMVII